jgi:nitronate monooxygenase
MSHDIFDTRIVAAPMAGGTSTPAFVTAVHNAGGLGFLAAGYKSVDAMQAEIRSARAAGARFGMNVFVPDPAQLPPSAEVRAQLEDYRARLRADALRYGVEVPPLRLDDDDHWQGKIDALLADPVELVSFAFGLPGPEVVRALQRSGSAVLATVTTVDEALEAAGQGVDALVVQHGSAGGHSAAFQPGTAAHDAGAGDNRPGTTAELLARCGPPSARVCGRRRDDRAGLERDLAAGARPPSWAPRSPHEKRRPAAAQDASPACAFSQTRLDAGLHRTVRPALVNEFVRDHPDAPGSYPAVHHSPFPARPRLPPGMRSG